MQAKNRLVKSQVGPYVQLFASLTKNPIDYSSNTSIFQLASGGKGRNFKKSSSAAIIFCSSIKIIIIIDIFERYASCVSQMYLTYVYWDRAQYWNILMTKPRIWRRHQVDLMLTLHALYHNISLRIRAVLHVSTRLPAVPSVWQKRNMLITFPKCSFWFGIAGISLKWKWICF